jgi:hypothetical protein
VTDAELERIAGIRKWRDQTRAKFDGRGPRNEDAVAANARAWWKDVDALLRRLDELEARPRTSITVPGGFEIHVSELVPPAAVVVIDHGRKGPA